MSDGTLSLRRRDPKASELASSNLQNQALKSGAYEYFADFENIFGTGHVKDKSMAAKGREERVIGAADEFRVESVKRKKLRPYDKFLKEFKYGAALDAVMENVSGSRYTYAELEIDIQWCIEHTTSNGLCTYPGARV
jgi:U3 small nucleolar RNA-associated protein 15